jgi:hypothetical protein
MNIVFLDENVKKHFFCTFPLGLDNIELRNENRTTTAGNGIF